MKKLLAILLTLSLLAGFAGVSALASAGDGNTPELDLCCRYFPLCDCDEREPGRSIWRVVFDFFADAGNTLRNDVEDIFNTVMDILRTIVGFFI